MSDDVKVIFGLLLFFGVLAVLLSFVGTGTTTPQYKCTQVQMEWILNKTKDFPERDCAYRQIEIIRSLCDKED